MESSCPYVFAPSPGYINSGWKSWEWAISRVDWVARARLLQLDCLFPARAACDRDCLSSFKVRCICMLCSRWHLDCHHLPGRRAAGRDLIRYYFPWLDLLLPTRC
jgi:hypothetical protein